MLLYSTALCPCCLENHGREEEPVLPEDGHLGALESKAGLEVEKARRAGQGKEGAVSFSLQV